MTTCTCDTHICSTSSDALNCSNTSGNGKAINASSNNSGGPTVQAVNTGTAWNSNGVYASTSSTTAACIWGEGGAIGVHGKCYSSTGKGVFAENGSSGYGLYASSNGGYGVYVAGSTGASAHISSPSNSSNTLELDASHGGVGLYVTGNTTGTLGTIYCGMNSSTAAAIYAYNSSSSWPTSGAGVVGQSDNGTGVSGTAWGIATLGSPTGYGVSGIGNGTGIFAQTNLGSYDPNNDTNRFGYAVQAQTHCPSGKTDMGVGVYASGGTSTTGYAGYFNGRLYANYIMKGGGGFTIDHPLDPDNHFLNHGFVEAPEMSNLYKGQTVLDAKGQAVIDMPDYFMAMNKDAIVTLTSRSGAMPNLWADGDPCVDGKFTIKEGTPGGRVAWFVMAVRNDAYVKEYGMPTKQEKKSHEKGLLMHPELHGYGEEKKMNSDNMIKNMGAK